MPAPISEPIDRKFQALWQTHGLDETLHPSTRASLARAPRTPDSQDRRALDGLPRLAIADCCEGPPELKLHETLGQGGMGHVRLATQVSLGRQVAIKTVRPEKVTDATVAELVREARVTGALEHPNIIPVYALGRNDAGQPMLVMKRVDGTAWRDVLHDPDGPHGPGKTRDRLEYHLDVLVRVCEAMQFAHSVGIVHRDLKPDNVMVGAFGQVYVLDWGVAVRLREEGDPTLPLAARSQGIVGTPAYMAPEMVSGDGTQLRESTDVYLLGAILHEIVTGRPPHDADTLYAALFSAFESAPRQYGPEVPAELADLCNRAMAANPADRFASVAALRDAVQDFLRHRHAVQLAHEAWLRLDGLRAAVARLPDEADDLQVGEQRLDAYRAFAECRFGLQQALRIWPESPLARRHLQEALELMIDFELDQGDPRAAALLLAELPEARPELHERVEAGERDRAQALETLRQLQRDQDLELGRERRSAFAVSMAIVWAVAPLSVAAMQRFGIEFATHGWYIGAAVLFAINVGLGLWLERSEALDNAVNRNLGRTLVVVAVALLAQHTVGAVLDVPVAKAILYDMGLFLTGTAICALWVERKLLWAAAVYLAGIAALAVWPGWAWEILGLTNLGAMSTVAVMWRSADARCAMEGPPDVCQVSAALVRARVAAMRRGAAEAG